MKVRTGIKWVAAIMLMVVLCFSVTVAAKGYGMYREAMDSVSLEDKVASIRAKENYTTFDQLPDLRKMTPQEKNHFEIIGASCHSLEEAKEAERLGCTYITAGHIFLTDCKKGLPGRGLTFLQNICENVSIPVYAIGGISNENINDVRQTGAAGACIMSGFMKCNNIAEII